MNILKTISLLHNLLTTELQCFGELGAGGFRMSRAFTIWFLLEPSDEQEAHDRVEGQLPGTFMDHVTCSQLVQPPLTWEPHLGALGPGPEHHGQSSVMPLEKGEETISPRLLGNFWKPQCCVVQLSHGVPLLLGSL